MTDTVDAPAVAPEPFLGTRRVRKEDLARSMIAADQLGMPASPWRVWDTLQAAVGHSAGDAAVGQHPTEPAPGAGGTDQEVAP